MSPYRTWLFVPGDDSRKLAKALAAAADAVVVDWEDAVADSQRGVATTVTADALKLAQHPGPRVGLRVRASDVATLREGLESARGLALDFLMLPKAEEAEVVREAGGFGLPLVLLLESAKGIERAAKLAGAHGGVERFAFGHLDFLADIGGMLAGSGSILDYARSRIVVSSKASGLRPPIDGIYPKLGDRDGLITESRRARSLGFEGKLAIHPSQLGDIEKAFQPDDREVAFARRVVDATASSAISVVDGHFVDKPLVLWARSILDE